MPIAPSTSPDAAATDTILGLGSDLCAVARCARELGRSDSDFAAAVLRPRELARCHGHPHPARALAALVAGKEAVIKALARTQGQGTFWQDVEIDVRDGDRPVVVLHGRIAELARQVGVRRIHLAWARSRDYATACAIATGSTARRTEPRRGTG
jgi:holo-[acyl-carrier protein] synthase